MVARIDLTGQRFARWEVLSYAGNLHWLCRCECGTEKHVHGASLRRGATSGCIRCHPGRSNRRTHGMKKTRLYNIWCGMKRRCLLKTDAAYPHYGGRGITVCLEWRDNFKSFATWAYANGYSDDLTLDRKNNNLGYEPGNCRWATHAEQNRNYSRNRPIEHEGRVALIGDFASDHSMPADVVRARVFRYGWAMDEALNTPVRKKIRREPWIAHGMSKSTYYRAKREGRI